MSRVRVWAGAILAAAAFSALLFVALSARAPQPAPPPTTNVGALGSPGAVVTEPPLPSPLPSPPELGLACGEYVEQVLIIYDVAGLSALADAVATGRVTAIGDARWATVDGEPPVNDDPEFRPNSDWVYRVVTVEITGVGKHSPGTEAAAVGASVEVRILGGTIGCRTFKTDADLPFDTGSEVVLFLASKSHPSLEAAPAKDFDVIDLWPIEDGVVQGRDGSYSPEELLSISMAH